MFILQNFLAASGGNKKAGDEGHLVQQSSKLGQSFYKVAFPFLSADLIDSGSFKVCKPENVSFKMGFETNQDWNKVIFILLYTGPLSELSF